MGGHDRYQHRHQHSHGRARLSTDHARWWARLIHVAVPHSHDANEAIQSAEEASGQAVRAAWIGLAGMAATAIAQVAIVAISGSMALLADTVHNLGHAVTSIPLIIAFKLGQRPASSRYNYGFRRAEDLVGLLIGLVVAITAAIIIWESIEALTSPREVTNLGWVLAAGIVGFLGNEVVAVYRIRAGRQTGSAALVAEGQHARADGLTSVAVVLGVVGVWFGFPRADAIVGLLIGLAILWILVSSMRTVCSRLMDGVAGCVVEQLTEAAVAVAGVAGVDRVRARWTGHRIEGDASIRVSNELDVLGAHRIADEVEHAMLHAVPHLESVVVHLHPVGLGDDDLHELSGHHANTRARRRYQAQAAPTT